MRKRKSLVSALAALLTVSMLAGCSSAADSSQDSAADSAQSQDASTASESAADNSAAQDSGTESAAEKTGNSNILIVYFDYSENMGDTSSMDVDAITSASLDGQSYDGITENDLLVMKDEIEAKTGADIYSVQVNEPYDPDYETMVGVAQDDQNDNKQFTFKEEMPDLSQYDTVYMGTPVWWGGLPQPMICLLDQYDFTGTTIIPFGIHLGSRFGRIIDQYKEAEPMATVVEDGLTENAHTANDQVREDVDKWLDELASSGVETGAQN